MIKETKKERKEEGVKEEEKVAYSVICRVPCGKNSRSGKIRMLLLMVALPTCSCFVSNNVSRRNK